jgi:hypothetical protein
MTTLDKINMALISTKLMTGKVDDAEKVLLTMNDPAMGKARIEEWKETYADFPHGQWRGRVSESKV